MTKEPNVRLGNVTNAAILLSIILGLLIYFKGLIQPFILAIIIWYLIRSIRDGFGRIPFGKRRLPKGITTLLALGITFLFFWTAYQIILYNVNLIIENAEIYKENLDKIFLNVSEYTGIPNADDYIISQLAKIDFQMWGTILLNSFSTLLGNAALVLVYVLFLLLEESYFPVKIQKLWSSSAGKQRASSIFPRITQSINTYFYVKTFVSLLTAALSYLILLFLHVEYAALWAFIIFLFNFIPYVGSLIATLLPAFFALFQFASFTIFFYVLILIEIVQLVVGNYVEPKITGKSMNLSPLIVLLALAFWGSIWGIVGMVLSVPIISVIAIVMAHFDSTRPFAMMMSEKGSIDGLVDFTNSENNSVDI